MLIDFNKLGYDDFENLMHDLFVCEGFQIDFHAGIGPDGKRDLIISKVISDSISEKKTRYVVQCKKYQKTVGSDDVIDISDTITRYQVDGFILAVTSTVSQPLLNKCDEINKRSDCRCLILRPFEIYEMVTRHQNVFLKYFPEEYSIFKDAMAKTYKQDIIDYLEHNPDIKTTADELEEIRKDLILFNIKSVDQFKIMLANIKMSEYIHSKFQEILKRRPTLYEYIHFSIFLSNYREDYWNDILNTYIMSLPEFISRIRIILNFDALPISEAVFDNPYQHFYEFFIYHPDYIHGKIQVSKSDVKAYKKSITISSLEDGEFRVVCLNKSPIPMKKTLAVDYNFNGFFQLFILVKAKDGELYYVQYIDGEGDINIVDDKKPIYIQIYNKGINNGPNMLRKEMHFYNDLLNYYSKEAMEFLGLYLGVKGYIRLYNILLV